jgi:ribosomal protein L22
MSPESEKPDDAPLEDAPSAETERSEEPSADADSEASRPVSAADATSTAASAESDDDTAAEAADTEAPAADESPEPEADDEDDDDDDEDEDEDEDEELDEDDEEPEGEGGDPAAPKRRRRGPRRKAAEPEAERPAQAAPRRRRSRRDPDLPPPVVRAQAKYVRSSARKARLVCDHIRGKSVDEARAILALTPRAIARDWSKLLESAVANAENNHELVGEDLYIKAVHADEGPTIKRFRPRAMGRATKIRKRTSHLTILLEPKD